MNRLDEIFNVIDGKVSVQELQIGTFVICVLILLLIVVGLAANGEDEDQ